MAFTRSFIFCNDLLGSPLASTKRRAPRVLRNMLPCYSCLSHLLTMPPLLDTNGGQIREQPLLHSPKHSARLSPQLCVVAAHTEFWCLCRCCSWISAMGPLMDTLLTGWLGWNISFHCLFCQFKSGPCWELFLRRFICITLTQVVIHTRTDT